MALTKPHIVLLTSATGGGHTSCAKALQHAFQSHHADTVRVSIVDLWTDYAPWPLNLLPRWYYFFTNSLPLVWLGLWKLMAITWIERPFFAIIGRWVQPQLAVAYRDIQPDVIIALHPLVQRGVRASIQTLPTDHAIRRIPWFTVVTDLVSAHPVWFDSDVTQCFVPTHEAVQHAQTNGYLKATLRTAGLPSLPATNNEAPLLNSSSAPLLIDPTLPAILLMGGAEGMGPLSQIANAIDRYLCDNNRPLGQLVIICGSNERLRDELSARYWSIPVKVLGMVPNVQLWMQACDVLVTKAGPSTMIEAFNNGLPIILSGYLPGQEAGNVGYVVTHGAGLYCPNADEIGGTVRRWLVDNPAELLEFSARSRQLAQQSAADDIVRQIMAEIAPPAWTIPDREEAPL